MQLNLITDDTIKKSLKTIAVMDLSLSPFNPRHRRDDEQVTRLAQRISRNGFELTRALWVHQNGDGCRVFAGGTRLEAAKRAGVKSVPCIVHEGLSETDIVRLAYEDNENDEYHAPVSIVDVWANYAALAEQGWTQQKIADAVGVKQAMVSYRLKLNNLPDKIKQFISQYKLSEAHLTEIMNLSVDLYFRPWLTTEAAQLELCQQAADKRLTVRETRKAVAGYKTAVSLARQAYNGLDDKWRGKFVSLLANMAARTSGSVQSCIDHILLDKKRAAEEELAEAQRKTEQANAEAREAEHRQAIDNTKTGTIWRLGRHYIMAGNAYADIPTLEAAAGITATALITDPPYGIDYDPTWPKWNGNTGDFSPVSGDDRPFDPTPFLDYETAMLFGANYYSARLPVGGWVCWDKRTDAKKDNMLGSPFELAWFKSRHTTRRAIMIRVLHGGVINADSKRGNNEKRFVATQKPVKVMAEALRMLAGDDDVIIDPFAGSGSTLLACEKLGMTCLAMDCDPDNVKIIISRWEADTGKRGELWQE